MEQISSSQINFHLQSFCDPYGRVFWWNGHLYRGINSEHGSFFKQLFQDGLIQRLVDRELLVETDITELSFEQYGMVLRHRLIPFVSYAHEWCAQMLRGAAITVIELLIELARHRLSLRDPNPWNILFDGCKPFYVDLTSIIPIRANFEGTSYQEFCRFFLYPLILMTRGQDRIARWLLWDYEGIQEKDFLLLTQDSASSGSISSTSRHVKSVIRQRVHYLRRRLTIGALQKVEEFSDNKSFMIGHQVNFLEGVRKKIEDMRFPLFKAQNFSKDKQASMTFPTQGDGATRAYHVPELLTKLRPTSVLNIGDMTPEYSAFAATLGAKVVSFDKSPSYVSQMYHAGYEKKLSILPLLMDFLKPTPSYGLESHWFVAATERLQCEMVVALGLVHQIVFERYLNFEQIASGLALFSKNWLIVDFIRHDDQIISQDQLKNRFAWYTLENFMNALKKNFTNVNVISSCHHPHDLLLCEK